ncbi:MAG: hypothetical protein AAGF94_06180 [Pseudomonadota bacterium]
MALILSCLLFAGFVMNVVYGAMSGTPALGDVSEMLLLFAAAICFVVAILKKEAQSKDR